MEIDVGHCSKLARTLLGVIKSNLGIYLSSNERRRDRKEEEEKIGWEEVAEQYFRLVPRTYGEAARAAITLYNTEPTRNSSWRNMRHGVEEITVISLAQMNSRHGTRPLVRLIKTHKSFRGELCQLFPYTWSPCDERSSRVYRPFHCDRPSTLFLFFFFLFLSFFLLSLLRFLPHRFFFHPLGN